MKAKLIKTEKMYVLSANDAELHKFKSAIDTNNYGWVIADVHGEGILKLSAKNCDEIFGEVDVEKFAFCEFPNGNINEQTSIEQKIRQSAFKIGFNKAMELNQGKVFTFEDMRKAIRFGLNGMYGFRMMEKGTIEEKSDIYIKSLQQPTEIEVEIEMGQMKLNDDGQEYGFPDMTLPKLDSNGCLILKRAK